MAKLEHQEWVISIECICTDRTVIPLSIIFKVENLSKISISARTYKSWFFSHNKKVGQLTASVF